MLRRCALIVVAFLVGACAVPPADAPPTADVGSTSAPSRPPLELDGEALASCQIGRIGSMLALCGTLTVPEDPAAPEGRTIDLRVAVIPAVAPVPEPDPVFMLAGGPGDAATQALDWTATTFIGIHATRDIVLVDQRGVGGSNPMFVGATPDMTGMTPEEIDRAAREWVASELARFDADPRLYTTSFAMDDVDAVRAALGYERINLFGASYGATAAQYYIRQHADRLRTVVLDGGTLLDVPVFERIAPNSQAALDELFERCAAEPACAAAYPDLAADLEHALATLASSPIETAVTWPATGDPLVLDAPTLASTVHTGLLATSSSAELPWLIHAAGQERWDEVATGVIAALGGGGGDAGYPVMSAVIRCSEAWARYDPAEVARLGAGSYYLDVQLRGAQDQAVTCRYAPQGVVPGDDASAPRTEVPVLLLVGSADPQDPPANIAGATEAFPHSTTVVAEGHGHTVAHYGCLKGIVDAFVAAGTVDGLDTSCVADGVPPVPFRLP